MTEMLQNKLDAITEACERHGVIRLDAFGSALRDEFQPGRSDVDLLVELGSMEPYARVDAYFGLLEDLRAILGEQVDLVISGAVKNPYIAREIARTKELLYAA
ncbi:MAG: nucleotidyltransferase domain-containing protein [Gemmatimonadota bacterium]|nr:nucleotidyltransferase domain-containing protein [Gemmatimonadota bacterium]